jgi:hypothetical protein
VLHGQRQIRAFARTDGERWTALGKCCDDSPVTFPDAVDATRVGSYPAHAFAGGGYVWDEVLEYRVWCSPSLGAKDVADGTDYFYAFASFAEAEAAANEVLGAERPVALVLQREYIDESEGGGYRHVKQERVTEWPVEFLTRPRRDERTIPDFLAPTPREPPRNCARASPSAVT